VERAGVGAQNTTNHRENRPSVTVYAAVGAIKVSMALNMASIAVNVAARRIAKSRLEVRNRRASAPPVTIATASMGVIVNSIVASLTCIPIVYTREGEKRKKTPPVRGVSRKGVLTMAAIKHWQEKHAILEKTRKNRATGGNFLPSLKRKNRRPRTL
jgi:uncharacterized protein YacL